MPITIGRQHFTSVLASLNRRGGNTTGVATVSGELEAKRLGLLRELVPSATSMAVLVNPIRRASMRSRRKYNMPLGSLGYPCMF
jgi:hypothetical protein